MQWFTVYKISYFCPAGICRIRGCSDCVLPVEGAKAALIEWEGVLLGSVGLEGAVIGQDCVLPVEGIKAALIGWEGVLTGSVHCDRHYNI